MNWKETLQKHHGLVMAICCIVPFAIALAASYIYGDNFLAGGGYLWWLLLLLCPLMHYFMMKEMHTGRVTEPTGKSEGKHDAHASAKPQGGCH